MATTLDDIHATDGSVCTDIAGRRMPQQYGDPAAEYRAAIEGAALFDLSHFSKVELAGPDARTLLHNLCTSDVKTLPVGAGSELFLTTAKARVVAHGWVGHYATEADSVLLLDTVAGQGDVIRRHLDHYLISEQVELADRTAELALLRLAGPSSPTVMATALGADVSDLAPGQNRRVGLAQVRRQHLLGLDGFDLFCPATEAAGLWERLRQAGAQPAGIVTYEVLRVEAGLPEFGPDIDDQRLAMEVGRTSQAICYTKGCYLGQETIVMARDRGQVNRTLLGIKAPPGTFLTPGTKLHHGTDEAGQITSVVHSPRLGQPIALAYLRRASQQLGTELQAQTDGGPRWVSVASLPFVSPEAR